MKENSSAAEEEGGPAAAEEEEALRRWRREARWVGFGGEWEVEIGKCGRVVVGRERRLGVLVAEMKRERGGGFRRRRWWW